MLKELKRSVEDMVAGIKQGRKRYGAELMSLIETDGRKAEKYLSQFITSNTKAHLIGVTGWPGVGKSSLVYRMARSFLAKDKQVGIIAIDPSSPFSGGSLLGDRERMKGIDGDERLFIRSMATRGHVGGIARSSRDFIRVMEAMGKEIVILETVGVGQDQVAVTQLVDTIILVLIPGMGDYLQSLKAGVLEIGDIFVVNKSDRVGVNQAVADLKMMVGLSQHQNEWIPPIVKTIAINGNGTKELMEHIDRHRQHLKKHGLIISKKRSAAKAEIIEVIMSRCIDYVAKAIELNSTLDKYARKILEGSSNPYRAADEILMNCGFIKPKTKLIVQEDIR